MMNRYLWSILSVVAMTALWAGCTGGTKVVDPNFTEDALTGLDVKLT